MEQNKFKNDSPEQVIIISPDRIIKINYSSPARAYGLFDTKTGTQVSEFVKGNGEQIEFSHLEPSRHYDVGVIQGMGNDKPQFTIIWTANMRDDTDEILKNSGNLPVEFPRNYKVKYKDDNSDNVYDLVDDSGATVGQVIKLAPLGDKPQFIEAQTFRMKDVQ